jgi:hypothetical protein
MCGSRGGVVMNTTTTSVTPLNTTNACRSFAPGVTTLGKRNERWEVESHAEHVNDHMADVVRQCRAAGVSVFVKQVNVNGRVEHDLAKFPEALRVREYPAARAGVVA